MVNVITGKNKSDDWLFMEEFHRSIVIAFALIIYPVVVITLQLD